MEGPLSVAGQPRADGRLRGSRCAACAVAVYPADPACPRCGGPAQPGLLSDTGTLWTWTVQRYAPKSPPYVAPAAGFTPFTLGYIELGDEVRVLAVLDIPPQAVTIGMRLRIGAGDGVPRATAVGGAP
ncbi:OB-fold domain-containing protein [Streptomyces sp. ME02-8801-2C]|uniref:Zn-ribbon domain-containing OB-fold protein n=1 Tax=Streptomyces sp. ME02-8801-2C TaxID=3028680 RepID=UPI0029BE0FE1|nr:OB-fold domain-containing protein [Streptomyces sp. ME02-8801-2C]MDX3452398.1 OB-fold domain-containing protein [Streptomyces sp. ME02-8801-2C]